MRPGLPAAVLGTMLLAGCVQPMPPYGRKVVYEDQIVEVPQPLPPDQVEIAPPPPAERLVWVKGHWR